MADFHRRKRGVHKMLRDLDRNSREAMKAAADKARQLKKQYGA